MRVNGFQWDFGNWPKCGRHGVPRDDIESIFLKEVQVFPDKGAARTETRFNAVGTTDSGRHVFVVFVLREGTKGTYIRPISARYMHAKEIKHYERKT